MAPRTELDTRYSDEAAVPVDWGRAVERLAAAEVAWIVTVRSDGRPHATPMVPVTRAGRVYFHTGAKEVKYANLQANARVLVLAGDTEWRTGVDVALEGVAEPVAAESLLQEIADLYRGRWDGRWELDVHDGTVRSEVHDIGVVVFEVTPTTAYAHAKGDPFGHTTYRF